MVWKALTSHIISQHLCGSVLSHSDLPHPGVNSIIGAEKTEPHNPDVSTALIVTLELGMWYYRWTCSEKYCWRRDRDGIEYVSVDEEAKNFGAYHSKHIPKKSTFVPIH